jgi:hypothetical protein
MYIVMYRRHRVCNTIEIKQEQCFSYDANFVACMNANIILSQVRF